MTRTEIGANATLRLLNNSLVFQLSPKFSHYHSTGDIHGEWNPFMVSAYGQYYLKNFNFSAYWSSRSYSIYQTSFVRETSRSNYYIQLGWSNGTWNLSLYAANLFRTGYDGSWAYLNTPLYSEHKISFNGNYRRSVAVTAIYTFGYGKKIKRGDEIGRQSGAASAIMK